MDRRVAPLAALIVVLSVGGVAFAAASNPALEPLAAVTWPVSTLLVSEVQTGGGSASDEFAEITNVGASTVDLSGLELVYVTSTGSTVTRKAAWATSTLLGPGRHLFIANTSGIYAGLADATYSGGFAATGGALVLRTIGGAPVDAVGWGDATNSFVEGSPIGAPAASASIERKPGGLSGNTTDTNANATDWFMQASPNPQSLAAPPAPAPVASSTPNPTFVPTPAPSGTPVPTDTPAPSAQPSTGPTPVPTAVPTEVPAPTDTAQPTTAPTPEPTATPAPTPEPTLTPEPTPSPTPATTPAPTQTSTPTATPIPTATPAPTATPVPVMAIIDARSLANGAVAHVTGVLTTHLGALEAGRKAFIQDDTAGIAVYLDAAVVEGLPSDTLISVTGAIDDRFAERTIRAAAVDVLVLGEQARPQPWLQQTGTIGESIEGTRVLVQGVTVGSSTALSDGLGLMVDDGTGQIRVIVGADAFGGASIPSGTLVVGVGPVGQRDSSGTGLAGYRVHATEAGDFGILPPPTPTPTITPSPTATPIPTATPSSSPSPTPTPTAVPTAVPTASPTATPNVTPSPTVKPSSSPSPSPTPGPTQPPVLAIVEARGAPVGTVVTVSGVVTAEAGRLGLPPLIAIADGTGGIAVRLPDGVPSPARGTTVTVKGPLADPYGQLELRPASAGFRVTGQGSLPAPLQLAAASLGEGTEGRIATLTGMVKGTPQKGTSGDLTIELLDPAGTTFRVITDGSSQIVQGDFVKGSSYRLTGIVGQRASRKGALDGYRVYLRDRSDITPMPAGSSGPGASGAPTAVTPIGMVLALPDGKSVTIEASVTAGVNLLDTSGRRVVVQDASGAIEVFLPVGSSAPAIGSRLRVTGLTGHAWGAPRVAAATAISIGSADAVAPASLQRAPAERDEWLLVRLSGTILKVERLGDRWRAEIQLASGAKVPLLGQAGAGIPSTAILAGRRITVTGIVKRPYPSASDRRFALLPRNGGDVAIGPAGDGAPTGSLGTGDAGKSPTSTAPSADITPDTDLATLVEHVGARVRVGGLIAGVAGDGFDLDDGTALAHVVLRGDMAALVPHLREGDAVAATGTVEMLDGAPVVIVGDDGTLVRVGSLGQALPVGGQPANEAPDPGSSGEPAALRADSTGLGSGIAPTSALALASITAMSVFVTILRRRLSRRQLRTVLVDRLATLRRKEP